MVLTVLFICVSVFQSMLCLDPTKRITARSAVEHEYFKDIKFVPWFHIFTAKVFIAICAEYMDFDCARSVLSLLFSSITLGPCHVSIFCPYKYFRFNSRVWSYCILHQVKFKFAWCVCSCRTQTYIGARCTNVVFLSTKENYFFIRLFCQPRNRCLMKFFFASQSIAKNNFLNQILSTTKTQVVSQLPGYFI